MPRDLNCDFCNAGAPNLQGLCVDCDGCFGEHCTCDPCQHDKPRTEECVFCGRGFTPLVDVLMQQHDKELDEAMEWLMGPDQEMT